LFFILLIKNKTFLSSALPSLNLSIFFPAFSHFFPVPAKQITNQEYIFYLDNAKDLSLLDKAIPLIHIKPYALYGLKL